jgi:hypothetical protein
MRGASFFFFFPSHSSSDNSTKVGPLSLIGPLRKPGQRYYASTTGGSTISAAMKEITDKNFGLIIAFLLPGFLLVWLLSLSDFGNAEVWLKSFGDPSVSGFLYVTLASLALGLIISAVRWAVIDQILRYYFLRHQKHLPKIDFSKLSDPNKFAVFQGANENQLSILSILLEYPCRYCCWFFDLSVSQHEVGTCVDLGDLRCADRCTLSCFEGLPVQIS